jgi:hypothetical protein
VSSDLKPQYLEKLLLRVDADDMRRIDVWEDWEEQILSFDQHGLAFLSSGHRSDSPDQVEGYTHLTVSVPDGIFAPPLSDSQMRRLRYFNLHRFHDQCDTRGRLLFVNTFGRVIYLFWEMLKRAWMLIVGLVHFALFGGSPLPVWRRAVTRDMSAGMSNWKGEYEFVPVREWRGWWWVMHPFPYVWYGACALLWYCWPESNIPLYAAVTPVVFFLGAVLLAGGAVSYDSARSKLAEKKQADVTKRLDTYAVCADPHKAVARPVSVRLMWNGLKQAVCRPYRRQY